MITTRLTGYFKEVREELSRVDWPAKEFVVRLSLMVIAVSCLLGLYVTLLDYSFGRFVGNLMGRY